MFVNYGPILGEFGPKSGRPRHNVGRTWQTLAEFCQSGTKTAQFRTNLVLNLASARIRSTSAAVGKVRPGFRPKFGRHRPQVGRNRANLDNIGPTLNNMGPNLSKFDQIGALNSWSKLAQSWSMSAKVGRNRPKVGQTTVQTWPSSARIWSTSAKMENSAQFGQHWPKACFSAPACQTPR